MLYFNNGALHLIFNIFGVDIFLLFYSDCVNTLLTLFLTAFSLFYFNHSFNCLMIWSHFVRPIPSFCCPRSQTKYVCAGSNETPSSADQLRSFSRHNFAGKVEYCVEFQCFLFFFYFLPFFRFPILLCCFPCGRLYDESKWLHCKWSRFILCFGISIFVLSFCFYNALLLISLKNWNCSAKTIYRRRKKLW